MRAFLLALLVAAPVLAAEEPEAVYAKFHKAGVAADFDGLRKYGTAKKGEELASMPPAELGMALRFMAALLPKAYAVDSRVVTASQATLKVSAKQAQGTVYGVVTLVREGGEWKVDEEKWGEPGPRAQQAQPKPVALKPASIAPSAAQGSVNGAAFRVQKAELRNGILELRQGSDFFADQSFTIFLFLKGGESLDGKRYVVAGEGFGNPHVHLKYKVEGGGVPRTEIFMDKYRMTLEFSARNGSFIPGRIDLRMPDKAGSFVSGTFEAEIK